MILEGVRFKLDIFGKFKALIVTYFLFELKVFIQWEDIIRIVL